VDGDGLITQEENDKYLQITKDQLRSSLLKTSDVNVRHVRDPLDEMFKQSSPDGEDSSSSDEDLSEGIHVTAKKLLTPELHPNDSNVMKWMSPLDTVTSISKVAAPKGVVTGGYQTMSISTGKYEDVDEDMATYEMSDLELFLDAKTPWGKKYEIFIFFLIFLTILQTIVETVPSIYQSTHRNWWAHTLLFGWKSMPASDWFEAFCVITFTIEWLLRLYGTPCKRKFAYIFSFYSMVDLLSFVPYYLALINPGGFIDEYDEELRMIRMLRLLKLDKYVPCLTLIDDVLRAKRSILLLTGYAGLVFLLMCTTLLYLTERDNYVCTNLDDDTQKCLGPTMAERFASVPMALPYTLILLTGDYPLVDFTFWGRCVNFFMVVFGVGICAIPSSAIASGFVDLVNHDSDESGSDNSGSDDSGKVKGDPKSGTKESVVRTVAAEWQKKLHAQLETNPHIRGMAITLILSNVAAVIIESEPSIGGADGLIGPKPFDIFEFFSLLFFSLEFLAHLASAPCNPKVDYSYSGYIFSFYGVVDMISIFPSYIEYAFGCSATIFRIFRLCRMFQLEHFMEAFTLLDDVFRACADTLTATGILALIIWVAAATLFFTCLNAPLLQLKTESGTPMETLILFRIRYISQRYS